MKTQTNTAKHTPTPWHLCQSKQNPRDLWIGDRPFDNGIWNGNVIIVPSRTNEQYLANAEFICQAVNQHDQLIAQREALREILTSIEADFDQTGCSDDIGTIRAVLVERARSALALCEPKDKEGVQA